jgi:hypothetical protein
MRILFVTFLLSVAMSSHAFALSISGTPPEHDWTVTAVHRHYGIGGDSRGTYISYGSDFVWVRWPFWQFVSLTSVSVLAIGAAGWFITRHRHAKAA